MQPQEPFDLPDAALPEVEPIQPQPAYTPPTPQPIQQLPQSPPADSQPQPAATPAPNPLLPPSQGRPNAAPDGDQGRSHLSGVGKKYFKLIEFDDEEILLTEIRKHPFGLFIILLTGTLIAVTLFAAITALASSGFLDSLGLGANSRPIIVFAGFLLALFVILVTMINAYLYHNNVVFVTNEKLAQILYITLFNRKISQLSIGDVQDVTVSQKGFFPNIIGYGTLVIETAGEQQNYTFSFVPHPYENSKIIINAHESNLKQYGN